MVQLGTYDLVLLMFLVGFILIAIFFYLGRREGIKESTEYFFQRTDMIYPSVEDVTIRGSCQIPRQKTEQIAIN